MRQTTSSIKIQNGPTAVLGCNHKSLLYMYSSSKNFRVKNNCVQNVRVKKFLYSTIIQLVFNYVIHMLKIFHLFNFRNL